MEDKTVKVTYDSATGQFDASENPVVVTPGLTRIVWTIGLTNESTGEIHFGTDPDFRGIDFAGDRPGTVPKGDKLVWTSLILDVLKPGDPPKSYHYNVNAWYADRRTEILPEKKTWDPEVEEEPKEPPPV
jgi:hypothetical protein